MAEVHPGEGSKIKADKRDSDPIDAVEEGKPTYPDQFCGSKQDAERGAPTINKNGDATLRQEGSRLFSVIPPKLHAHISPNSNGSCSPFRPAPLRDFKPFPSVRPSLNGAAASADDGSHRADVKDDEETVSPQGTSVEGSGTSTPRKKINGVSALTYALQMEAAKKGVSEVVIGASGSELQNDTDDGGNTTVQPLQETRPRPQALPWIPVLVRGPDGCPVVKEINQESELQAEQLVKPLRLEIHETGRIRIVYYDFSDGSSDGIPEAHNNMDEAHNNMDEVEAPSMWRRCFLWCGRMLCCRDYEPL